MWEVSEIYDGCKWYRLDTPMMLTAIHIGRWRNHDDRAEWDSWTAIIASDMEHRMFFPPCTPIDEVKTVCMLKLAEMMEAEATMLRKEVNHLLTTFGRLSDLPDA